MECYCELSGPQLRPQGAGIMQSGPLEMGFLVKPRGSEGINPSSSSMDSFGPKEKVDFRRTKAWKPTVDAGLVADGQSPAERGRAPPQRANEDYLALVEEATSETIECWDLVEANKSRTDDNGKELGSDQIVPRVNKAGGELSWEKSDLAKFSNFLGFSIEGLEKDIMEFLIKIRDQNSDFVGGFGEKFGSGRWSNWAALDALGSAGRILGGFNVILSQRERSRQGRLFGAMRSFAQTVDDLELIDLPMQGDRFWNASLVANEVIDYWYKRKEKGLICKLDIEKAYDSINWKFLMKVLRKMGFGSRWMDWMWWCISTAKFSILINGVPAGFFSNSKGLRQGDPLSPYLFVLGMEVLSTLIRQGGRITLIESTLASIPIYLLSLIRIPKAVAKRIEKIQRDFLWEGSLEGKVHLINWKVVCSPKEEGGLGIRKIDLLNKALLGKWVWRYAYEKDNLWKTAIGVKYGQEGCGWKTKEVCGPFGVGLWKEIMKEADWCWESMILSLGQGGWNLSLARDFNDWEMDQIGDMLNLLKDFRISPEEDSVRWKREGNGVFGAKGPTKG
ncbi:putative ribonuclease H protein [Vitis vinifera]|uniref:Putative ribonuclease H protein n=1 Tax=Vitis vinifera TaxID=29760 RepID=A0A438DUU8_VITVI|nr:putative ribonuclease H protein [Vitis vinifera]